MKAREFIAHAQYHVTCAQEVPKKPHVIIFWPRIVYSLYNFYGATMTIKGSCILEHSHVKANFGRKKTVQLKSVPKMTGFQIFKGSNMKYSHRDPPKGTSLPGTTSFDVFCVNIRPGV